MSRPIPLTIEGYAVLIVDGQERRVAKASGVKVLVDGVAIPAAVCSPGEGWALVLPEGASLQGWPPRATLHRGIVTVEAADNEPLRPLDSVVEE